MLVRLIVIALLLPTLPASGAFLQRHEHWTVTSSQSACAAFNRPLEEMNAAPYNALSIRQRRGRPPLLQVFTWPDVFKQGQASTIEITINGARAEMEAEAGAPYYVEAKTALPDAFVRATRDEPIAQFHLNGVPQVLIFDLKQLEPVMRSLDACIRQLPG